MRADDYDTIQLCIRCRPQRIDLRHARSNDRELARDPENWGDSRLPDNRYTAGDKNVNRTFARIAEFKSSFH